MHFSENKLLTKNSMNQELLVAAIIIPTLFSENDSKLNKKMDTKNQKLFVVIIIPNQFSREQIPLKN